MDAITTIKPINTKYKGYLFRSRLEARWAKFFDTLDLQWEYEPEGFDMGTVERYCYPCDANKPEDAEPYFYHHKGHNFFNPRYLNDHKSRVRRAATDARSERFGGDK